MRKKEPLSPLLEALRAFVRWLRAGQVRGVIIGGVAASILGRPRMTRDIDALILLEEKYWDNFLSEGAQFDFARIT